MKLSKYALSAALALSSAACVEGVGPLDSPQLAQVCPSGTPDLPATRSQVSDLLERHGYEPTCPSDEPTCENTMNRAELAKALTEAVLPADQWAPTQTQDIPDASPDAWYYQFIQLAIEHGWLTVDENGLIQPAELVTTCDLAALANLLPEAYTDLAVAELTTSSPWGREQELGTVIRNVGTATVRDFGVTIRLVGINPPLEQVPEICHESNPGVLSCTITQPLPAGGEHTITFRSA
ncbi:hypothetical protein IPJ72_04825 [Candidatus Peregrinibacteria bacterium]|nr:MAG: hypothetical protein IPJ72_04825 [Candidatus Peregrinibacteria bacterium]